MEVERIWREWDVAVSWAPFFLDPSIPPEGRERKPQTSAETPKSHLEEMGERRGIEFRRGRTFTPNSHLALQAGEYAAEHGTTEQAMAFHRALFKAYFTDFENLSEVDVLVRLGAEQGFDAGELREALESGRYREQVDRGIAHSYQIGVTGVPTFIFNGKYAVVGAQEYETFERVLEHLGARRRNGAERGPSVSDLEDFA